MMNANMSISAGPLRDFNRKCQNLSQLTSKEESSLMITINAVKNSLNDLEMVDRNSLETRAFFVNLYQLMEKIHNSSMLFSQSLTILEQCCLNPDFRQDLVDKYKFLSVLAVYLNRSNDKKTVTRILSLLNELCYGIRINWPEPFLVGLVQRLFEIIGYKDDTSSKESCAALALSVLVNLSYKNPPVIEILFTMVNTDFLKTIQSYGILTMKMYYILGQNSPKDILASIKLYFLEITKALRNKNACSLKQTVDFALDIFKKEADFIQTHKTIVNDNLEELLEILESIDTEELENIEGVAKLLHFFNVLMNLDYVEECQYARISKLTTRLIRSPDCTGEVLSKGLEIFQSVAQRIHDKSELFYSFDSDIPRILGGFNARDIHCKTAILKFVRTFVRDKSMESIFFDHVQEDFFKSIFEGVESLGVEVCHSKMAKFSNDEILFYIICLATLSSFSTIAPVRWFNMIIELFKHKSVQLLIVEGILRHTEEITYHIFELSKVVEFPNQEISLLYASKYVPIPKADPGPVEIESQNTVQVSKQQCEKIDEILDEFEHANRNGLSADIGNIIHLCQHQRNVARNSEKNYEIRLQQAGDQINNLSHKIHLLEAEIGTLQTSYFSLELFKNNLSAENSKKHMVVEELKRDILNYKTKHDSMKVHYDKMLQTIQDKARSKEAEMKDQLKKLANDFEEIDRKLKEETRKTEQMMDANKKLDTELQKKTNIIENLTEENKSSHNLIDHLKEQIEDKDNKVKELEDIQNTIINMMQGTKKKKTG